MAMTKCNTNHGVLRSIGLWEAIQVTAHEAGPGYVDSEENDVSEDKDPNV